MLKDVCMEELERHRTGKHFVLAKESAAKKLNFILPRIWRLVRNLISLPHFQRIAKTRG